MTAPIEGFLWVAIGVSYDSQTAPIFGLYVSREAAVAVVTAGLAGESSEEEDAIGVDVLLHGALVGRVQRCPVPTTRSAP